MSDNQDRTTIVNIRGVDAGAWEKAKRSASRTGENMGEWLSRAANLLSEMETGERVFPPDRFVEPPVITDADYPGLSSAEPIDLAGVAAAISALAAAGLPVRKQIGTQINQVLDTKLRAARGLPPRRRANQGVVLLQRRQQT